LIAIPIPSLYTVDTWTLWQALPGSSGSFLLLLPTLSQTQGIDNRLQGIVDFNVSFRNYPRHHENEARRRGC
jgi:hypothetical protein